MYGRFFFISEGDYVKFAQFVLLAFSEEAKTWLPFFSFKMMYNKTIIRFGFCDIQNNQGLHKGYQPKPKASAYNPYLNLDSTGFYKKNSSNNWLI